MPTTFTVEITAAGYGETPDAEALLELSTQLDGNVVTGTPEAAEPGTCRYAACITAEADSADKAATRATQRFTAAVRAAGLPAVPIVALRVETDDEVTATIERLALGGFVGVTEIGELLGVSKQRANQFLAMKDFPAPIITTRRFKLWSQPDITDWAKRTGRTIVAVQTPS